MECFCFKCFLPQAFETRLIDSVVPFVKTISCVSGTFKNDLIFKEDKNYFIYTGCQILSKKIFINYKVENFSITRVWNSLIEKKKLFGFESNNDFYHLTDLKTFKKLQDL